MICPHLIYLLFFSSLTPEALSYNNNNNNNNNRLILKCESMSQESEIDILLKLIDGKFCGLETKIA